MPFEVPESWVWTTFGNVCKKLTDGSHNPPPKRSNGYTVISAQNIKNGKIVFTDKDRYSDELGFQKENPRTQITNGDIILGIIGGSIGNVAIFDLSVPVIAQRSISIIDTYVSNIYCFYLLQSTIFQSLFLEKSIGNAQAGVYLGELDKLYIPLPPLSEQQRIVAEIKKWFALIDQIEQGKVDMQTIIKQTKSKILDLAIHGKLVPQDPNDEPAIELLKRINPGFTPCDNGHYTQLPEGWAICKMKQITSITNGKSQKNVETLNGIYPIYGSGGVIGRANQYLCIAGSTIIGRKGTINNPIFVEEHFWNVDTAFGLKANDAILDKYLYYFCLSFDFSKLDKSTAMPSLTKTSIGNVLIPIPPYKEQERIVAKIDMVLDTMNEILRAV